MKILMVSEFYPPYVGGAEQAVADLSAELSARGHNVLVATLWHEGLARCEHQGSVVVHRMQGATQRLPFVFNQPDRQFHPPVPDPLLVRQIERLIAKEKPDVVHGHNWMMLSALSTSHKRDFAAVATLNDYALLCPKKSLLYHGAMPCSYYLSSHCLLCARDQYGMVKGLLITAGLQAGRRVYRNIDAFIAISSYVAEVHARDAVMAGSHIVTIPNFVREEVTHRGPGSPLPYLPDDYILFVGQLSRHKGLHVLLDAYGRLHTPVPLVLIGPVQLDTPTSLPSGVMMYPGQPHEDVLRAMDHCRFLVSAALWPEPFGLVAIEAMARGKAVIASRAGGMLDIVQDGRTGLLVTPGNATALTAALRQLLDDSAQATRMGRAGAMACAANYSAANVVERVLNVYQDARLRAIHRG
ncbi:MAG: glycosyl transferase group 1 [Chloroflexi bacterium]|nr:glycosyl transferase group 1 [Chloroflexota bacterium]